MKLVGRSFYDRFLYFAEIDPLIRNKSIHNAIRDPYCSFQTFQED